MPNNAKRAVTIRHDETRATQVHRGLLSHYTSLLNDEAFEARRSTIKRNITKLEAELATLYRERDRAPEEIARIEKAMRQVETNQAARSDGRAKEFTTLVRAMRAMLDDPETRAMMSPEDIASGERLCRTREEAEV